jgi:hypothetical protein
MENNVPMHTIRHGRRKLPLPLLLERTVLFDDMQSICPPFPQLLQPTVMLEGQAWEPKIEIDERARAFSPVGIPIRLSGVAALAHLQCL